MDPDRAKEILSVYREDLANEDEVGCRQALSLLEENPALAAWFEEERRFDQHMAAALEAIPIPQDLEARIVAQTENLAEPAASASFGDNRRHRRPIRTWWAAAAAILIVALALFRYFSAPDSTGFPGNDFSSVDAFRSDMAWYATTNFTLAYRTDDLAEARAWLEAHRSPTYEEVPPAIVEFNGLGCQTFPWGKHQVSLICFRNENDEVIHLFIIDRDSLEDLRPAAPLQEVLVQRRLETGGWLDEQHIYLLVGSDPDVGIGNLLKRAG